VNHNGRRIPASEALRQMMSGESAIITKPQIVEDKGSLAPSADALAALSDADRAALERGEGIEHLTRSADVTIRTKQDDGNHGASSFFFRTNPETGAVERSHGPDHLAGGDNQPTPPTVKPYDVQGVRTVRMRWDGERGN
jgi:hypothetical protein